MVKPLGWTVKLFARISASGYQPISVLGTRCATADRVQDDERQDGTLLKEKL